MKSNDFSPITDQGEIEIGGRFFSKLRKGKTAAPVAPGYVRVLLDGDGAPLTEVSAGQKYWSRARGWIKVDVRSHPLQYDIQFPDPSGLAGFVAGFDVSATVTEPAGAVLEGADGVEEIIRPTLQNAIRKAHAGSPAPLVDDDPVAVLNDLRVAADRSLEALVGPVPAIPGWLTAKVTSVSVRLDDATEEHRKELMSRVRAVALTDADGKSDMARARNENLIRRIREEGFEGRLSDPEKRALARIAADPSRENIDRVAGQFDQIEAQGRAVIAEVLREAFKEGYLAEDDAIHYAIRILEKQGGMPQGALGESASPKQLEPSAEGRERLVEAETVEAKTEETKAGEGSRDHEDQGRPDSDWKE